MAFEATEVRDSMFFMLARFSEPTRGTHLLDGVSKRYSILAHAPVPRDDGQQRWRLAEQLRGCEVDGVECPDRFDRKRTADAIQHRSINVEDEAASFERAERAHGGLFLLRRKTANGARPNDGPPGFGKCQSRSDQLRSARILPYGSAVAIEECGDEGARFDVPDSRVRGRGTGRPDQRRLSARAPWWSATLRHGRRR